MAKQPKNTGAKNVSTADYRSFSLKIGALQGLPPILPPILMKQYSVSIYKAHKGQWSTLSKGQQKEALSRQWYIRWYFRSPTTGKMERQKNIYGPANSNHTYKERIDVLRHIKDNLIALLKTGFSPYGSNKQSTPSTMEAIGMALEIKAMHMKPASFVRFRSDINKFRAYLIANGYERRSITSVTKRTISDYLNFVLATVSARSRNNYKVSITTLWQQMEDDGICPNIAKGIPMLQTKPQKNKAYTDQEVAMLFKAMEGTPLLLFVQFVAYNFLRPLEVCRLTVGSFDLNARTLTVMVKQGRQTTKTIPDILQLPNMAHHAPDVPLFGRDGLFTYWNVKEDVKRAYFTAEFSKVRDDLNLDKNTGLYSFRHWAVTKVYRTLRGHGLSPYETKAKLMTITGHGTMAALEKYLRSIDAELAEDYSNLFDA